MRAQTAIDAAVVREKPASVVLWPHGTSRHAVRTHDLFERTAWLYAFLRERVFRDDTDRIQEALWPAGDPLPGSVLLEIGCGPGLYARQLAARNPGLLTVGIDRSPQLLALARARAVRDGVTGCRFEQGDALALDWPDGSVDSVVASRLFTVVDGRRALSEIRRVLRPGGRCFIAEPSSLMDTLVSMASLRAAGWLTSWHIPEVNGLSAPPWPRPMSAAAFEALVLGQPWSNLSIQGDGSYHYATCQKPARMRD